MTHETPPQPEPLTASRDVPIGPWHRSSRSRLDEPPPHRLPNEERARLDIVWADHDRTVPVAANDYDGCYAVVLLDAARLPVSGESERLREALAAIRDSEPMPGSLSGWDDFRRLRDIAAAALTRSSEARTEPERCAVCDHPMTEHRTPGAECIHARCSCDLAHDAVLARTEPEAEDGA